MISIMTELTQKLLLLDTQTDTELLKAQSTAQKIMSEADSLEKEMKDEAKQRIKYQKKNDLNTLDKNIEEKKGIELKALHKQMEKFDNEITFDDIIEDLISIAKNNLCS